ncbi:unnamed protein product [Effrenium voratum]|nr:unnamed protein product [Effrenium voratum]
MDPFLWNFSSRLASPPSRPFERLARNPRQLESTKGDAKDLKKEAVKIQRRLKKLQQEEKKAEDEVLRTIGDARKEKAQFEKEATATASKLLDAQAKLAEEKKSEDALQGALNKLQPKSFFGLF